MKLKVACIMVLLLLASHVGRAFAQGQVLGVHLLSPTELSQASKLLFTSDNVTHSVTVPLTFDDLNYKDRWQSFLDNAHANHIMPIIRLATRFENGVWVEPDRSDVIRMASFTSSLHFDDELT